MREEPEMNARHQRYSEISFLTPTGNWKLHTFQTSMKLLQKGEITSTPGQHSLSFDPMETGDRLSRLLKSAVTPTKYIQPQKKCSDHR